MNRRGLILGMGAGAIVAAVPSIAAATDLENQEREVIHSGLREIVNKHFDNAPAITNGMINTVKREAHRYFSKLTSEGKIGKHFITVSTKGSTLANKHYDIDFHYLKRHAITFEEVHYSIDVRLENVREIPSLIAPIDMIGVSPLRAPWT